MPPFSADPFRSVSVRPVDPALTSFADEVCATVARLFAYVGTLALVGILAVHGCDQLLILLASDPNPGSAIADRSEPGSPADETDLIDKPGAYSTFGYPSGGNTSQVRAAGDAPAASEDWLSAPKGPRLRGAL